eukprot:5881520-Pyramimonas_sp.AAC.2
MCNVLVAGGTDDLLQGVGGLPAVGVGAPGLDHLGADAHERVHVLIGHFRVGKSLTLSQPLTLSLIRAPV